jgi:hypothetical protein
MHSIRLLAPGAQRTRTIRLVCALSGLVALLLLFFVAPAHAGSSPQEQEKHPLGSLSSVGEVYVNDSLVPAQSTVFAGDEVRTGDNGTATFATSGKGSFKIAPHSWLVFVGSQQNLAELKWGTVVMSSLSGPGGINLRAGKFVIVAVTQGEQSTSKIDGATDGSVLVTCVEGSVGVLPLEGANGLFLQVGQSVSISAQGELSAPKIEAAPPPTAPAPAPTSTQTGQSGQQKKNNTGLILLLAGGGGAAGIAAALAGHHGGSSQPVSPAAQ